MKKYWLEYRMLTGLGSPVKLAWFDSIMERYAFAGSVEVLAFGQRG